MVQELQLNPRGDWLGRWLAHHVAELIRDAEEAKDVKTRREASRLATETILKIWDHRASAPGAVNPLAHYRDAIQSLLELRRNASRWHILRGVAASGVAGNIYRRLPRLMSALILLPSVRGRDRNQVASEAVRKFLKKDESRLLSSFEIRMKIIGNNASDESAPLPKDDYVKFEEAANELIDETIADLRTFRKQSKTLPPAKPSKSSVP